MPSIYLVDFRDWIGNLHPEPFCKRSCFQPSVSTPFIVAMLYRQLIARILNLTNNHPGISYVVGWSPSHEGTAWDSLKFSFSILMMVMQIYWVILTLIRLEILINLSPTLCVSFILAMVLAFGLAKGKLSIPFLLWMKNSNLLIALPLSLFGLNIFLPSLVFNKRNLL